MTHRLRARRAGVDTYQEPVVFMHADCPICRSEGFAAQARVELLAGARSVIATVNHVRAAWVDVDEAALSEAAWKALRVEGGQSIEIRHAPVVDSLRHIRGKIHGAALDYEKLIELMRDISANRVSDLHLAAFLTACAADRMSAAETTALTRAMVDVGDRLSWPQAPIVDKHCVGGLPGNRTTPVVVAIAAACGAIMPKTSSRAITSPAGTADTMEMLAPVELDLPRMRRVVEREGGCVVWGGAVRLSPADDVLIRVERPLNLDSDAQLVASVLSKKVSAGSQTVLIDIPVGPSAKVRSAAAADRLAATLAEVGAAVGLQLRVVLTDGSQPVGRGIGPALEAWDVLAVLQGLATAPVDLRARALLLAGEVLEMAGRARTGEGAAMARTCLDSGRAWAKFQAICEAQGGMREPPRARHSEPCVATADGTVTAIDNRVIATVAKLAGAPAAPAAGVSMAVKLGDRVERGQPLFHLHAQSVGELAYARAHVRRQADLVTIAQDA